MVKLFSSNSDACDKWVYEEGCAIDEFMIAAITGVMNATNKDFMAKGAKWLMAKNPERTLSSAEYSVGMSLTWLKRYGNLVETGSKLVS